MDNSLTLTRKVVVAGYRSIAFEQMEPAFYIADLALSKDQFDQEMLYLLAQKEAREKGGLTGKDMVCFFEEDFAKIRAFQQQFMAIDRREATHLDEVKKTGAYHCAWEITVDADNPRDVAEIAREVIRNPGESLVFAVQPDNHGEHPLYVDLSVGMDNEDDEESSVGIYTLY